MQISKAWKSIAAIAANKKLTIVYTQSLNEECTWDGKTAASAMKSQFYLYWQMVVPLCRQKRTNSNGFLNVWCKEWKKTVTNSTIATISEKDIKILKCPSTRQKKAGVKYSKTMCKVW